MPKKYTINDYILKAKSIHGDLYDYSLVNYIGIKIPIVICCEIHGPFLQRPDHHIMGAGCPKCGGRLLLSREQFIKKSNIIHNFKYCYDKVIYKNNYTKVEIICIEHGSWYQIPNSHLQGNGCPKCAGKIRLTQEEFIDRAKIIHNNKYNYNLVNYINAKIKVKIICIKHGVFAQTPDAHLQGFGCRKCSINKSEQIIANYLTNKNILFSVNFPIKLPIVKRMALIDFHILKYNLLIEYNGIQHYRPTQFGNMSIHDAKIKFEYQMIRDQQLRDYCKINNINLLEIDGRKYFGANLFEYLEKLKLFDN